MGFISKIAETETSLTNEQVSDVVAQSLPATEYAGKKVLLIVPDATRTAPIGQLFKAIHAQICDSATKLDVMIALGTHHAMSEEAICERLEITCSGCGTLCPCEFSISRKYVEALPDACLAIAEIQLDETDQLLSRPTKKPVVGKRRKNARQVTCIAVLRSVLMLHVTLTWVTGLGSTRVCGDDLRARGSPQEDSALHVRGSA